MPKSTLKVLTGDVRVVGSLEVMGGIRDAVGMRDRTRLASTQGAVTEMVTDVATAKAAAEAASEGTYDYRNNNPPTNNVTDLAFTSEANADGSVDIPFSFKYIQGVVPAAGFLVFAKSDVDPPEAVNLATDASAKFIPASSGAEELTYADTLRALSVRYGGAGAMLRHYRFAVVAVSQCVGGAIPHNAGVVEVTSDSQGRNWTDKTFAVSIGTSEGNVMLSLEDQSLVFRLKSTLAELARLQYDEPTGYIKAGLPGMVPGSGLTVPVNFINSGAETRNAFVNNTLYSLACFCPSCVYLTDDTLLVVFKQGTSIWELVVSTSGVVLSGPTAILNYAEYGYQTPSGAWTTTHIQPFYPVIKKLPDGRVVLVASVEWWVTATNMTRNTAYDCQLCIRSTSGTWTTVTTPGGTTDTSLYNWSASGIQTTPVVAPRIELTSDNKVVVLYQNPSSTAWYEFMWTLQGERSQPNTAVILPAGSLGVDMLAVAPDTFLCTYAGTSAYIYGAWRVSGTWGTPAQIYAQASAFTALVKLTSTEFLLLLKDSSSGYVRRLIGTYSSGTSMSWSAYAVAISAELNYLCAAANSLKTVRLASTSPGNSYLNLASSTVTYPNPKITTGKVFSPVGMGAIEHGIDANNNEYLVLGDGTKIYIDSLLSAGGTKLTKKIQRFTSTGTWTCPDGVYSAEVLLVGGGGGGATGGGGGGAVVKRRVPTTPGTTYTVTIGAGGAAGAVGGTTSFGTLLYAYGGGIGGTSATKHGDHGTDSAAGLTGSADGGLRSCMPCDDKDKMFGGLNPSSGWGTTLAPTTTRITGAASNRGTGAAPGASNTGYSGYAEIEWEE